MYQWDADWKVPFFALTYLFLDIVVLLRMFTLKLAGVAVCDNCWRKVEAQPNDLDIETQHNARPAASPKRLQLPATPGVSSKSCIIYYVPVTKPPLSLQQAVQGHSALHAPGQLAHWQSILLNLQAEQLMVVTDCKLQFNTCLPHLARVCGKSTACTPCKVRHGQYG